MSQPRRRDRNTTKLRRARRAVAWIKVPAGVWHEWGKFFPESIKAFPGTLSDNGKSELALRLGITAYQAGVAGKLGIKEADRKKLGAILESAYRKLVPFMKRYPIIAQHVELPMWLAAPQRKTKEAHTALLEDIFTAYEETRQRHDCKAPAAGLNAEFRKFLDAVLIDLGLGPIGDKIVEGELGGPGMIGEGELKGAWRRWSGRASN